MAKKRGGKRADTEHQNLQRQMAENREAIRAVEEMYRTMQRDAEEARIERLPEKHRPKKRGRSK